MIQFRYLRTRLFLLMLRLSHFIRSSSLMHCGRLFVLALSTGVKLLGLLRDHLNWLLDRLIIRFVDRLFILSVVSVFVLDLSPFLLPFIFIIWHLISVLSSISLIDSLLFIFYDLIILSGILFQLKFTLVVLIFFVVRR